jgi:hypothetical protein
MPSIHFLWPQHFVLSLTKVEALAMWQEKISVAVCAQLCLKLGYHGAP